MSKNMAAGLVIGLLLIAALTGWALVSAVRGVTNAPATAVGGIATQVRQILNPTPTIYPDPVTVILQIRALSRLESAQYTIEKVITAEAGQGALAGLFGDRLLFVAHGSVIAGVDLSKLQATDITVTPAGTVTVIMPAPEVFVATLDNDKSYVYDRQTGLLTNGDINLETQARQVAEQEIERAALEDGILDLAARNAAAFMESLLLSLGFEDVIIVQATAPPP
ncbi:MAG: DUF4230 domain-containing protein [Anaerolineales bacterium]|nr:DUF4230 domain-containing protein [Anaerolineales bacterium]